MVSMTAYRQYRKRTRVLAVGFVLLYVLASVRSFVPGMCATQSALATDGASIAPLACCAQPTPRSDHSQDHNPFKKTPRCAFCQLVLAACTTTPYAADGSAVLQTTPCRILEPATARSATVLDTNVGRDPPRQPLS